MLEEIEAAVKLVQVVSTAPLELPKSMSDDVPATEALMTQDVWI